MFRRLLTFHSQGEVEPLVGRQGFMPYHTLVDSHIVFQRGLQPQEASDILIVGGIISEDALRNLHILGILLGPLFPRNGNVQGVEPTCHTRNKLFFIFFHDGLLWKQAEDWVSCQEREVMFQGQVGTSLFSA